MLFHPLLWKGLDPVLFQLKVWVFQLSPEEVNQRSVPVEDHGQNRDDPQGPNEGQEKVMDPLSIDNDITFKGAIVIDATDDAKADDVSGRVVQGV